MLYPLARVTHWAIRAMSIPMGGKRRVGKPSGRRDRRGLALLFSLAVIAFLTVAVLEFAYQSRVQIYLAANARDDLKAHYLAKSAMNLGVLLLNFQYELEKDALVGRFMRNSNFQIYPLVNLFLSPFTSGSLSTPVGGIDLKDSGATGFGIQHGDFEVSIEPEEGKLNLNAFSGGNVRQNKVTWLCLLMFGEQHDDLFEAELGQNRDRIEREQLISNIIDWVDTDQTRTQISDLCVLDGSGSGDEDSQYARRDADYEVKNAKMTSLEELRLVAGVNDQMYERFSDSFTIYPVQKVNLNLANFLVIQSLLCSHVAGASADNWPCRDPSVQVQVTYLALALDGLREFFANPLNLLFYYMSAENAPRVLDGAKNGQTVAYVNTRQLVRYLRSFQSNPELMQQFIAYSPTAQRLLGALALQVAATAPPITIEFNERNLLRDVTVRSPRVYKIVAKGNYGEATRTLTSVVDFTKDGGQYLYWREY
jgi:type II secretory pathway component PulK